MQAGCGLRYPVQPILELLSMGRAWLNSNTLAITPRCKSGCPSSLHSFNCFHSIPILLRMEEKGRPELAPTLRAVVTLLQRDQAPPGTENSQDKQIESSVVEVLLLLRGQTNFDDIVSSTNDSNQTLAHLSVLFGYISLLRHLVEWEIDLTVPDISGLTALHCAYLKDDQESVVVLLRGGAFYSEKKLVRVSRDLPPAGSTGAD